MINSLKEWTEKLKDSNNLKIVEGKKDKTRLESFGITNIITVSNSLTKTLDNINTKEIIILTDLDSHGKKLYSIIRHNLQKKGIKIDRKFREYLFKETEICTIEGINLL